MIRHRRAVPVLICALLLAVSWPPPAHAAPVRRVFCPILTYHHVNWLKPSDDAIEIGLTVPPTQFSAQLRYLRAHHYHAITAARLVDYLLNGEPIPPKPVVLTFDDGYKDMYTHAFPLLRRNHLEGTFFIIAGLAGQTRYLTWPQIETLARNGMDIESHTMTHPDLTVVPAGQVHGEIFQSRQVLQTHLHRPVQLFAYPYGTYNAQVLAQLRTAGYLAAFTTRVGWNPSNAEMLTLPRLHVNPGTSLTTFAAMLQGTSPG
jgi:peptidoglycan/xylan/chitin deacetylase (PgdA/CDA1 family)